jgi:uncharacterized membrane protein
MKRKNKVFIILFSISLISIIIVWILGYSPIPLTGVWLIIFLLLYALWDMPPKHKSFSYKDQQRAMRAFDRSDMIDLGKPDWAKDKGKGEK